MCQCMIKYNKYNKNKNREGNYEKKSIPGCVHKAANYCREKRSLVQGIDACFEV